MGRREVELLGFHDVEVHDEWVSAARTITEADIMQFACLTGDFNPLHVDHESAKDSLFRKPIAHGLLGISYMAGLASFCPHMKTLAFTRILGWNFEKPVYIGDTIKVRTTVIEKEEKARGRRGLVRWKKELLNQHDEVCQSGIVETLVDGRGASEASQGDTQS